MLHGIHADCCYPPSRVYFIPQQRFAIAYSVRQKWMSKTKLNTNISLQITS